MADSSPDKTTSDALAIWHAGVAAVDSARLVREAVSCDDERLMIAGETVELAPLGRIIVVGAGKAGAGMARGLEQSLRSPLAADKVTGWLNVPADCVARLEKIHLHSARPAGVNEPTEDGVAGSQRILELVSSTQPSDLAIVLLSGGGSALLPAPKNGMTLADKQIVTRLLMQRGATIHQLNTVRKHLSHIKGGGLARACRAGKMICLIISDVIGDPLDIIASGPTASDPSTPLQAYDILKKFVSDLEEIPANVRSVFERAIASPEDISARPPSTAQVTNVILGNNASALDASARQAASLGYRVINLGSNHEGIAREVGVELAEKCRIERKVREPGSPPVCLLSGGEPVVNLVDTGKPRKGGRNQELALAALGHLWPTGCRNMVVLSGGTDGEDGPTDAAGAYVDQSVWTKAREQNLEPAEFLAINNAYLFFKKAGGLIVTGPTHTNVMDVRVCLIA